MDLTKFSCLVYCDFFFSIKISAGFFVLMNFYGFL